MTAVMRLPWQQPLPSNGALHIQQFGHLEAEPGLFDMALKNLGFFRFLKKKPKKPKKSEFRFFRFLENKNLMSDLSFKAFFHLLCN